MRYLVVLIALLFVSCETSVPDKKGSFQPIWNELAFGERYTGYVKDALREHGDYLLEGEIKDLKKFCIFDDKSREDYFVFLISVMAKFESNFDTYTAFEESFSDQQGNPVISRGLLQISIESSRNYKCNFNTEKDLHTAKLNLECGVRILNYWAKRDSYLHHRTWVGNYRGGARYWAVLREGRPAYQKLSSYITSYCER